MKDKDFQLQRMTGKNKNRKGKENIKDQMREQKRKWEEACSMKTREER